MYESFYGFRGDPFRLTPDQRFCYYHRSFRKAKAYLDYGVQRAEGFVLCTGRPGTGKTTLINDLILTAEGSPVRIIRIASSPVEQTELVRTIAFAVGLRADHLDKAALLRQIIRSLDADHRSGRRPILVVDEAQALPEAALEELRFLTNLEKDGRPLLQIFLVGQEPLRDVVRQPGMEQLHQRLIAACHLEPLAPDEIGDYIDHRLSRVGWNGDPRFSEDLFPVVHRLSGGIPRRINHILARLLMLGFVEERRVFELSDLVPVIEDLREEMLLPCSESEALAILAELPSRPEVQLAGVAAGGGSRGGGQRFDGAAVSADLDRAFDEPASGAADAEEDDVVRQWQPREAGGRYAAPAAPREPMEAPEPEAAAEAPEPANSPEDDQPSRWRAVPWGMLGLAAVLVVVAFLTGLFVSGYLGGVDRWLGVQDESGVSAGGEPAPVSLRIGSDVTQTLRR